MLHFVFPSDPLSPKKLNPYFAEQAYALKSYPTSMYSIETGEFYGDCLSSSNGFCDAMVVYRGWMLDEAGYRKLAARVENSGGRMLTSPEQYLNGHHLPRWYSTVASMTADTVVFPEFCFTPQFNLPLALKALGWERCFIKDYVKSLKLENNPAVTTPQDVLVLLDAMTKYRGQLEGGICVRRFEVLTDERRFFIVQGRILGASGEYPLKRGDYSKAYDILEAVRKRINSPFYSVDLAMRDDGQLRVVEIGDGQVSDLVGWTPEQFANIWTGVYHD